MCISATLIFYLAVNIHQKVSPFIQELSRTEEIVFLDATNNASEIKWTCHFRQVVQAHFSAQVHQLNLSFAKDIKKNHNVLCQ
jgi:hypothetical protein